MGTILHTIDLRNAAGASVEVMGIFVVYDLPDRDYAALASKGEYSIINNGMANYKSYIDNIVTQVNSHSGTPIALVIGNSLSPGGLISIADKVYRT